MQPHLSRGVEMKPKRALPDIEGIRRGKVEKEKKNAERCADNEK